MSSLVRKVVSTLKVPEAIGLDSEAVLVDRTINISGQVGMDPASGQLALGEVVEAIKQVLTNMGEILKAAGCDFTNVVKKKKKLLLADMSEFGIVSEINKQYSKSNSPILLLDLATRLLLCPKEARLRLKQ
jgi:reactive intermediate/imine deaminase